MKKTAQKLRCNTVNDLTRRLSEPVMCRRFFCPKTTLT